MAALPKSLYERAPTSMKPERLPPPLVLFGHYAIETVLGKGGMATVYRARELEGPRKGWAVALKRIQRELASDPAYIQTLTNEANLCRRLAHPNIVELFEVGEVEGIPFLVTEYVDGRDLGRVLGRCRDLGIQLPIDFAVHVARVLLDALAYAHGVTDKKGLPLGIVHCDVSPSNVFVSRTGEIKLGDFGIARTAASPVGPAGGKLQYISPEGLRGVIGPDVDIWAANCVLYELLTLNRPFQASSEAGLRVAIERSVFAPVRELRPDVPPALAEMVERGFSLKPARRFRSAAAYARALQPHYDDRIGTPLGIAAVVRALFGQKAGPASK